MLKAREGSKFAQADSCRRSGGFLFGRREKHLSEYLGYVANIRPVCTIGYVVLLSPRNCGRLFLHYTVIGTFGCQTTFNVPF